MAASQAFIGALREAFAAHADARRAAGAQAYMKSTMPFYGLPMPLLRRLAAATVRAHPMPDARTLADTMRALWRGAHRREERYAAMELARTGANRRWFGPALLPLYEHMIRDGAWWDYCDNLSSEAIGRLLLSHPQRVKPLLRRWAHGDSMWLRRAAIIAQRGLKDRCDAGLLYDCIAASLDDPRFAGEFFIRKGIGWALRSRSYDAPDEVSEYCRDQAARLSALTRREAMKAIARATRV
jgi:3-methyladenine DNA glycosylase AlkD